MNTGGEMEASSVRTTSARTSGGPLGGARRIVRIGGLPKQELRSRLRSTDIGLNHAAELLFQDDRFVTLSEVTFLETVQVCAKDFGLREGGTFAEIVERAASHRLAMCPLELGPHLRLQFTDQPEGFVGHPSTSNGAPPGSIIVASPPLDENGDTPRGFYLRRINGILWLRGYRASPDHVFTEHDLFLFSNTRADSAGVEATRICSHRATETQSG